MQLPMKSRRTKVTIVKAPIPNHGPIGNLKGTGILIRLGLNFDRMGLNFDHAGINSAMTHVLVLSAKVRRYE